MVDQAKTKQQRVIQMHTVGVNETHHHCHRVAAFNRLFRGLWYEPLQFSLDQSDLVNIMNQQDQQHQEEDSSMGFINLIEVEQCAKKRMTK